MYHSTTVRLAADKPRKVVRPCRTPLRVSDEAFLDRLRGVARRLRRSVPFLTAAEGQRLDDIQRSERRYLFLTLRLLLELGWRSRDPGDRHALLDMLTELYGEGDERTLVELEELATRSACERDLAERAYARGPNPATADALEEAASREAEVSRMLARYTVAHPAGVPA